MEEIFNTPEEIWGYLEEHREDLLGQMYLIAQNENYGIQIWLTIEDGNPYVIVEADDDEIYREDIFDAKDAEETISRVYEDYLSMKAIDSMGLMDDVYDEDDPTAEELEISMREEELDDAVSIFISEVTDGNSSYMETEVVDDLKEHFLEYMARKWDMRIYRPMFLEDCDDGKEYYSEYPYEEIEYEDKDNPLYK